MKNIQAFTLIELLVVVLIIGILSAVALPQYQKAVWKSRATQLLTTTRSLANAQEIYKMASGEYATAISELDIDFASLTPRSTATLGTRVPSTDAVRGDNWTEIIINHSANYTLSTSFFIAGPYRGTGFFFLHYDSDNVLDKKIYCIERTDLNITEGIFCTKLFNATNKVATKWSVRIYEMP
ncbi:type IV pilin protein [Candidatus Avelusimicrobium caledoniensis]|uniref:type IV pilin protein n=1 Tax=Candidatus Avelusimicrobium caledoniensis TaxID=3416220 RepID=UPI003D0C2933